MKKMFEVGRELRKKFPDDEDKYKEAMREWNRGNDYPAGTAHVVVDQLKFQAMSLSATERADLASFLLDSRGPDAADVRLLGEVRETDPSLRPFSPPRTGVA